MNPQLDDEHAINIKNLKNLFKPYSVRKGSFARAEDVKSSKVASVLIALQWVAGDWHVLLTKRAEHLSRSGGEICFPGGIQDKEDCGNAVTTAYREAEEEIGLTEKNAEFIAQLPWIRTRFNIVIYPIVAVLKGQWTPSPSEDEVAELFTAPLSLFLSSTSYTAFRMNNFHFHSFIYDDKNVFGITAWLCVITAHFVITLRLTITIAYSKPNA
uniref:Nudix hydrolase domain-containing protein n=1 Tax=Rhabditophanes sp. KR3021 TaxID=114890 RepID=A0AC35TGN7_9BILA